MFKPATQKINNLHKANSGRIKELEKVFSTKTNLYIDYANVRPWSSKLKWHVDFKRLKQLLDSFSTINKVKIYTGTLQGDVASEKLIKEFRNQGYEVVTKPVKTMRLSVDVSSIPAYSPDVLKNFVRKSLLKKLSLEDITYLNEKLKLLNSQGIKYIEDLKCNFDVEIGVDMLFDSRSNDADTFVLWSGDSDFANPISQLINEGKKVYVFASARLISQELSTSGAQIYDVRKLKSFICWPRELVS